MTKGFAIVFFVLALLLGASLLLSTAAGAKEVPFMILAEGTDAVHGDERANYRIRSVDELVELWAMVHGSERPPLPQVDFSKNEILAVFDGSHATGGHQVEVLSIIDEELVRTVRISHIAPGEECIVSQAFTKPYVLVVLPKLAQGHTLTHVDQSLTQPCS